MARKAKEFLLNAPEHQWVVFHGYHFHKSFTGVLLIILGLLSLEYYSAIGALFIAIGIILIILSILGHIYSEQALF